MDAIVPIKPGEEIEVDRAKLTESAVLVRCKGVWIELRPEDADRELQITIARLSLNPGDILVVKSPKPPSHSAMSHMVPAGVRVLYIPPEVELSVLTKSEIDARSQ